VTRTPSPADDGDGGGDESPTPGGLSGPDPDERPRPRGRRTDQGVRIDDEAADRPQRRAVLSAVVDHDPGVLSKVSGLFSRRQFNIESLTVGPTADEAYARITVVVEESDPGIEQVKKQLRSLVIVHEVSELDDSAVERETALIEVDADRHEAVRTAVETYGGEVVDATPTTVTAAVTGPTDQVDAAVETFSLVGVRELARTGTTALARGETPTTDRPSPAHTDGPEDPEQSPGADSDTETTTREPTTDDD